MKKPNGLSAIECQFRESFWQINATENGYEVIDTLERFQQYRDVDLFHLCGVYSKLGVPVEVSEIEYEKYKQYTPVHGVLMNYADLVCDAVKKGNAVLVPTGYCMYAPAIAGGIQRAIGTDKTIGLVWIDAHADNRIIENAPSTHFVGIPMSTMLGQTYPEWRINSCGLEVPLHGENVIASDIRICDEPSLQNMIDSSIIHLTSSDFENESAWKNAITRLADRVDAIYLSIDMDILQNEYTPAYIKNVPGGHSVDVVMRNVRSVMESNKVQALSLFCADFDRCENEKASEWTYLNAMKIIAAGLESWKAIPSLI